MSSTSKLCLVLTKNRQQFVCMRDGCKLPWQITTTVTQGIPESQTGTVEVVCEVLYHDKKVYAFKDEQLQFLGVTIPGVDSAVVIPREGETPEKIRIKLTCVPGDTQLEPYNFHDLRK